MFQFSTATGVAAAVAGLAFAVQALASPFTDSHVGYHLPNAVLALASSWVLLQLARAPISIRRVGRGFAWFGAVVAGTMGAFDVVAVIAELAGAGEVGVVEGIAHTFVLLVLLALVLVGFTARAAAGRPGLVIALSALALLVMVLSGLDQPEHFLVPELMLGLGWLWLASRCLGSPSSAAGSAG